MICFAWATRSWVVAVLLLTNLAVAGHGPDQPSEDVELAIQFLLNHVADSGLIFIRNSERHNARDAAGHMNSKYEYFRDRIKTPEDFIMLSATKSMLSGKPYLVILENGEEVRTGDWLLRALAVYRRGPAAGPE